MGFALKLRKAKPRRRSTARVDEAAKILDLEPHLDRKPANLSGGQRQRVAMGRAIVREPKAFLMDEPLSNLDAKLRVEMRAAVSRLQQRLDTTTVYVTHDQTEAMTLGDRVAVMRAGILQQVATPTELYENPRNLFVAGFIGSPAMNFFSGHDGERLDHARRWARSRSTTSCAGAWSVTARARKAVIVGIRPEDFEDAAVRARGPRRARASTRTIELTESMGSEIYAHFDFEGGDAIDADELARAARRTPAPPTCPAAPAATRSRASTPRSGVKAGERAELWLDTCEDAPLRPVARDVADLGPTASRRRARHGRRHRPAHAGD